MHEVQQTDSLLCAVLPAEPAGHLATENFLLTKCRIGLRAGSQAHPCPRYCSLAAVSGRPKGLIAAQHHNICINSSKV